MARLGGINRAAAELNTVQSNVTAKIKALEIDIGCPLFERRPRGVVMTVAGQRLLPYADRAMRLIANARRAARDNGSHEMTHYHGLDWLAMCLTFRTIYLLGNKSRIAKLTPDRSRIRQSFFTCADADLGTPALSMQWGHSVSNHTTKLKVSREPRS